MTLASLLACTQSIRGFARHYRGPILSIIVLLIVGAFVIRNLSEASQIARTIQRADPFWMIVALATHLVVISAAGLSYKIVLGNLGHQQPWRWLANLHLRRHMVGTVTPIGGPASVYVFVRSLGDRGIRTDDAIFAAAIRSMVGYGSFVMLLVPVLLLSRPSNIILAGAAGLMVFLLTIVTVMTVLVRGPGCPCWLPDRAKSLVHQVRSHQLSGGDLIQPFGLAIAHNLLGVATLHFCLLAVGYQGGLVTAFIGYSIGNLFMMIAPVFQGIGVVELTMAVSLQQAGVPMAAAVAATILFRFSDIWFPFVLGLATHAHTQEPVRRAYAHAPAVCAGLAGVAVIVASLAPNGLPLHLVTPQSLVAIVVGVLFLVLGHALWKGRPVAQLSTYGALVAIVPLAAFQAGKVLGASASLFHLAITAVIG